MRSSCLGYFFRVFCSSFIYNSNFIYFFVLITIHVSTYFSSALDKGNPDRIFYTLHYFLGTGNWRGGGDLVTWNGLGKDHMGEGRDFLVGEDTPKDTMLIKQASYYIYKKSNFTRPNKEIVFGRSLIRSTITTRMIIIWKWLSSSTGGLRGTVM